ncbi:AN1-type zinc finger protein 2A-like [Uloborus diversus]|uniref:AN1-type zinc finger protein 2A-like n=1 Tax=Uloborus diversus TaxID=327109 RepID=UPI002409C674|nr:AN1-type zinc finger protein 2A-like [Uloborus diversus]
MEFPDLGKHCSVTTCNMLDFLPMKCDACSEIFCKDHFNYLNHSCKNAYKKDVQVPVCPLCNNPVPSKRGEQPDIAVGQHIDRDCQADPAIAQRKIYTNKCFVKGCRQKEVIKITCDSCKKTYCLTHRHPSDHKCQEQKPMPAAQAAGAAAIARAQKFKFPWTTNQNSASVVERKQVISPMPEVCVNSVQGKLSEDEALALALHKSLNETKPKNVQEEEDRLLAQALANCESDRRTNQAQSSNRDRNCSLS